MLQLFNIFKQYRTGTLVQTALCDVSLTLRDNDFVSILGPSGSGKTTLLNIIGGLDRYDSGDLIIDGVSTRRYSGSNWDAYRNHSIGFVFQSYNLIPHQSVLANVELALTIGGIKGKERRRRAEDALREVGLEEHMHKRPNQLSGGQMQRVAIARALVNDPKILLADEPTGALDTDTGIQVMELLKKVAETRLVIMVTHNNELAEQYSTRIVRLRDGKIINDTKPITMEEINAAVQQGKAVFSAAQEAPAAIPPAEQIQTETADGDAETPSGEEKTAVQPEKTAESKSAPVQPAAEIPSPPTPPAQKKARKTPDKSKMGFLTSLSLSFNNLRTKKTRTIITSIAGSIGIIGIALILALSQGVSDYTVALQRDAMESFPITIDSTTYDYSDVDWDFEDDSSSNVAVSLDGKITATVSETDSSDTDYFEPTIRKNNLGALKDYFEDPANNMDEYVGTGSVVYNYSPSCECYSKDKNGNYVNANAYVSSDEGISTYSDRVMTELPKGRDNNTISKKKKDNYTVVYGDWPEEDNELVIITEEDGTLDAATLVRLGLIDIEEYRRLVKNPDLATSGRSAAFTYEEICGCDLTILPECHRFIKGDNGYYKYIDDTDEEIVGLIKKYGKKMKVTGIITPVSNDISTTNLMFSFGSQETTLAYTYKLTNYLIDISAESEAVKEQLENDEASVLDGYPFGQTEEVTAEAVRSYFHKMSDDELKALSESFMFSIGPSGLGTGTAEKEFNREDVLAMIDGMSDNKILQYYNWGATGGYCTTLEDCLYRLGYATYDKPTSITIYPDTFEGKQSIMRLLDEYNAQAEERDQITYYDYIKEITDGISQMVFGISMVLIAFVSISLVVSCIMIGIITHISVLERTKEIGILRALGASRSNISQVFNAETFIIGMLAGVIGIVVAAILCIPTNLIINSAIPEAQGALTATVPILPAIGLIILSTIITMIGGFIPAMAASRKDPVVALRTE